jgi:hypothetical protein
MLTYIYIHLKIKPNSVRIRFLSCQIFVLPSTWFELTPLIHCSTTQFGLIFRCIYIYVSITLSASIPNNFVIKIFSLIRMTVRWFPSDTQVSSTNKTDYHNIAKILLQTALKTNKHKPIVFLKKNGLDVTTTDVCRKDIILNAQPMKFLLPNTLH